MNKKITFLVMFSIFAVELLASTVSISVSLTTSNNALQSGDMSIVAQVDTTNITLYANASSALNVSTKLGISAKVSPGAHAIFNLPQAQFISGTSQNAMYQFFISDLYAQYLSRLQVTPIMDPTGSIQYKMQVSPASPSHTLKIYSLSKTGVKHLSALPSLDQFLPKLASFHPIFIGNPKAIGTNSVQQNQYNYDLNSFAKIVGVNQSDFNAIGHEALDQEQFKTGDVLSAGTRSYDPLSTANSSTAMDDTYDQYAINMGLIDVTGAPTNSSLSTEDLVGGTQDNSKYDVLTAGYNNFDQEAIQNPFIDFFVANESAQGITVDPALIPNLFANYTAMNNSVISQFESANLKNVIMGPVQSSLSSSSSSPFGAQMVDRKVSVKVFGISVYTATTRGKYSTQMNILGHAVPLLHLNAFTALSKATTHSFSSSVSNQVPLINRVKDMTSGGLYGAMHANTGVSLGSARTGSFMRTRMTAETASTNNPTQATHNSVSQSTTVKHNIISQLKTFLPFILVGVGAVAVLVLVLVGKNKLL